MPQKADDEGGLLRYLKGLAIWIDHVCSSGQQRHDNRAGGAADDARWLPLVEQARARVDSRLLEAERNAQQRQELAQQHLQAAGQAVAQHEAALPMEHARPGWWRDRRALQLAVEQARDAADDAQIDCDAARHAIGAALRAAWADLTLEASEQCSARLSEAQQARDAAQQALELEHASAAETLADMRAARLLDV